MGSRIALGEWRTNTGATKKKNLRSRDEISIVPAAGVYIGDFLL